MTGTAERTAIPAEEGAPPLRRSVREPALAVGDVLNGIYRVSRFIARGGMGEVFEGINVETDERVALKAIRGHLANDPKAIALFRKEARVLTMISHPAIVQYRVFAREPLLDLHYIVTDFIDGDPIATQLEDSALPNLRDVVKLARRLAGGLEAAHQHGAIHRDMSPDNVLLPGGAVDLAKIIDFGIAKSMDLGADTIVGDGFAGKLGYVAPEQFGDFGRRIGPWTDVYSTALVLLAYARGRSPAMGTTLSEAVERRRTGPDVTDLPAPLAPLFERMLVADPEARIRSMREVLAVLEHTRFPEDGRLTLRIEPRTDAEGTTQSHVSHLPGANSVTTFAPGPADPNASRAMPSAPPTGGASTQPRPIRRRRGLPRTKGRHAAYGAAVLLVVAAGGAANVALNSSPAPRPPGAQRAMIAEAAATRRPPADERAAGYARALADVPCGWLGARPTTEDGPTTIWGGAGDMVTVERRVAERSRGLGPAELSEVHAVNVAQCGAIDAVRPFRAAPGGTAGAALFLGATTISIVRGDSSCPFGGLSDMTITVADPRRDLKLLILQPDGRLLQIAGSRKELAALANGGDRRFARSGDGSYHATICYPVAGSAAVFLIDSAGALDLGLRTGLAVSPPIDFAQRMREQGRARDARVVAEWETIVQEVVPGAPVAPGADGPAAVAPPIQSSAARGAAERSAAPEPPRGEATRIQAAVNTADANRGELERLTRSSQDDPSSCRVFDRTWKDLGRLGRAECVNRSLRGRCGLRFAMYKDRLLRRLDGRIEEQRGGRWRSVLKNDGC